RAGSAEPPPVSPYSLIPSPPAPRLERPDAVEEGGQLVDAEGREVAGQLALDDVETLARDRVHDLAERLGDGPTAVDRAAARPGEGLGHGAGLGDLDDLLDGIEF